MIRRVGLILPLILIVSGCAIFQSNRQLDFTSADVLRDKDEGGLSRNDQCTLTDPAQLATLSSFFPERLTQTESTLHGGWYPLIIVRFQHADGTVQYVASDYRLYRMGDGKRGDFVVKGDFIDFVESLPMHPPPPLPPVPGL